MRCLIRRIDLWLLVGAALVLAGCHDDGPNPRAMRDVSEHFEITSWSTAVYEATSMAFLPDGRALVITKGGWGATGIGAVKLLDRDGAFIRDVLEVPVCAIGERGLLGIALDPSFDDEPYVYLFFTRQMSGCPTNAVPVPEGQEVWNRVARWRFDEHGMRFDDQQVLLDDLPAHQSSHNAGDLEFMPDGSLLVAVGEAKFSDLGPIPLDVPMGKILRIDPHRPGVPLPDNPWVDDHDAISGRDYVSASGFRNPFRIAVRGSDGIVVAADVGTDDYEEVNIVQGGSDYGFPDAEGPEGADGAVDPALFYHHDTGCASIIGGEFAPAEMLPATDVADDVFVYTDLVCGTIWAAAITEDVFGQPRISATWLLGHTERGLADITPGPDGSLYLVAIGPGPLPIERLVRVP